MALYLLTGTPGQSKGNSAKKIATFLRRQKISVGIGDVEEELLDLFPRVQKSESNQDPLVGLIGQTSQLEIKAKWPQAYAKALSKAQRPQGSKKRKPDVAIVVACLAYYRGGTYEYYSPVDWNKVTGPKPVSALTLIDDIYDIYYRLSQVGQVFDIRALQERVFPKGGEHERDPKDLRGLYKDALGLVIGSLFRVLVWRGKEIAFTANLCRTLECEHSVLAAKHPIETGARLLLGSTSKKLGDLGETYPVYVSHPISRPRREKLSGGVWPPFVDHLDEVVDGLSKKAVKTRHITPIMPTAIDEFRILDDGTYLQPHLTPRWRLPQTDLLYTQPKAPKNENPFQDYEDYERRGLSSIFDPPIDSTGRRVGLPLSDAEVSGLLRALKESIRLQMAGRDHLLVTQCPGLFLYRPLYGEFGFSSGVSSELNTFFLDREYAASVSGGVPGKVAFVHDNQDAIGLFKLKRNKRTEKDEYHFSVINAVTELHQVGNGITKDLGMGPKPCTAPEPATVATALRTGGDAEEAVKLIYNEMFPPEQEGSIGSEQAPPSWETAKEALKAKVQFQRMAALAGNMGDSISYTFSEDDVKYTSPKGQGDDSDTYVDVIMGLETTKGRCINAAKRAREFFVGAKRTRKARKLKARQQKKKG